MRGWSAGNGLLQSRQKIPVDSEAWDFFLPLQRERLALARTYLAALSPLKLRLGADLATCVRRSTSS